MKSQNPSTDAQNTARSILPSNVSEESGKNEPSLVEIPSASVRDSHRTWRNSRL
jgi:hypothetical protein